MRTAIITGAMGQDASYLAELLLSEGYKVIATYRRSANPNFKNIQHLLLDMNYSLVEMDLTDPAGMSDLISSVRPHSFYNLAAQSHVHTSFHSKRATFEVNTLGCLNVLEAIRAHSPETRMYQASTSELFGSNFTEDPITGERFQGLDTPFSPNSPYAISKLAAHNLVKNFRDSYGLHASASILFNHESSRRGKNFVTRKITSWVGEWVANGKPSNLNTADKLHLGNIEAYRDWGYAGDYMEAVFLIVEHDQPDDYIVATNTTTQIKDFLSMAFNFVGVKDYSDLVIIDESLKRPCEVPYLRGDYSKAKEVLGWAPTVSTEKLCHMMVEHDISQLPSPKGESL